ncbi:unnamed protein product [Adineta ricciae]|nr:unnamed protein product [Adineta ricciae]
MSEYNDIAGSEDIISLNYETQETFNEHSYRNKQSAARTEKPVSVADQAKENQNPMEQVTNAEADIMLADTQNYSQPVTDNEVSNETSSITVDTQNTLLSTTPFVIRLPAAQSTLTDGSSISAEQELIVLDTQANREDISLPEPSSKSNLNVATTELEVPTATNNLRLYVSPAASLHETANVEDAQPNPINILTTVDEVNHPEEENFDDKPKEEPMDTSDAQVSLGSDGIIESHQTPMPSNHEPTPASETSTKLLSPAQNKTAISPKSKVAYALSQPTMDKFEAILGKLTTAASNNNNVNESNTTVREEEEIVIKESISKTLRRYTVQVDRKGRVLSRDLLLERIVEENTTTRIESWPPSDNKTVQKTTKATQIAQSATKKSAKQVTPKRQSRSLKPTPTVVSPKKSKAIRSDDDDVIHVESTEESGDDKKNKSDEDDDDEDEPTDNISGEDFVPTNTSGQALKKGSRVYAKWLDGHFYPGIVGNINGDKCMIEYDDGGRRSVKAQDVISRSYLDVNQVVQAQVADEDFKSGIIKRLIKKRKTGNIGYVVEINGKERWYPLPFISLTAEQAEDLVTNMNKHAEETTTNAQGKRKRTSVIPSSPNKKSKSVTTSSPTKSQRSTFTPTRQTKLFNSMHFLLTGFNESIGARAEIQTCIESHAGKVIEKLPNANRRDNVYLISDKARKTAKLFDAKKANIPCVNYKWINESIENGEVQNWEKYRLVLPDKDSKANGNNGD